MISFGKKHRVVVLTLFLACCVGSYYFRGYAVGYIKSNVDIALGKPRHIAVGLPMYPDSMLAQILMDHYAVRFDRVASCLVTQYEVDFAGTYNSVVDSWLARKYQRDIWLDIEKRFSDLRRKSDTTNIR